MLNVSYGKGVSYSFPNYYSKDASWYMSAESDTKQYFIDVIKPHFKIIDAGAQIGMYTVLFSKLAASGVVYAFEPTDTVNLLNENLIYNNCKNVFVHNVALSNKDGIYTDTIYKIWSQNVIETKEFEFMTIDSFSKNNEIKPDLIKIDVDSYDFEVLQGCKEVLIKHDPIVMVELNHALSKRGYEPKHAVEFMKSINYQVKKIFDGENFLFTKGNE
jgi:FkbM family methyltransferase